MVQNAMPKRILRFDRALRVYPAIGFRLHSLLPQSSRDFLQIRSDYRTFVQREASPRAA